MTRAPRHPGGESGFAVFIAMATLLIVLMLGGALIATGSSTSSGVNNDELSTRALQAAEAGLATAMHRLNLEQPDAAKCIGTTIATPTDAQGWCDRTASESIGHDQSYRYQVSVTRSSGCTGNALSSATVVERCLVSYGTAGGLTRRVITRVSASSGAQPFPVNGILGLDGVTLGNNAALGGSVGSNGQISLGNNSSIAGSVTLWASAPNPTGYSGTVTRSPTPYVLGPPSAINPVTHLDSAASNDDGRLIAGANPADSCNAGNGNGGSCYVNTVATPRYLSLGNQGAVTLGGGMYNFCQLDLGQGAAVNIAAGAKVIIFIDSPDRPGSGCAAGQGGISSGNNALFSNPSGDPTALAIVVYGATAWPKIFFPNNVALSALILAPSTAIEFKNNSSFNGAISAKSVVMKNNGTWDARAAGFSFATTLVFYRSAWHQCSSSVPAVNAAANGCL